MIVKVIKGKHHPVNQGTCILREITARPLIMRPLQSYDCIVLLFAYLNEQSVEEVQLHLSRPASEVIIRGPGMTYFAVFSLLQHFFYLHDHAIDSPDAVDNDYCCSTK